MILGKTIFLFIFYSAVLFAFSFGNEINDLLGEYQKEVEEPSRTKKESLGHIITYSGQDLKMMQAYKLGDVLKTLPLLSSQKNLFGLHAPTFAGNSHSISTSMRLYINNHEVSSIQTLSPWMVYEQYPLDHISHIEIYWGEGSLSLIGDPSNITIKLYTKDAKRLNGGTLRANIDSMDSLDVAAIYGAQSNNSSLLAMINGANTNNGVVHYNGESIKNDNNRIFSYASLDINDFIVDVGYIKLIKDPYTGLAKDMTPDGGEMKSEDLFISATKYFDNRSGNFNISIDKNLKISRGENSKGIMVTPVISLMNPLATIPKKYNEDLTFTKYELSLSKEFVAGNNNLFLSTSAKRREYKINNRELTSLADTPITTEFSGIKYESILSVMLEDNYYLNDNNMLVLDLKYDKYYRNNNFDDFSRLSSRVGFVTTINPNFGIKAFVTNSFTPPSFFEIDYADKANKDLKASSKKVYSIETVYEDNKNRASLYFNHYELEDTVVLGELPAQVGFVNSNSRDSGDSFFLDYKRKFSKENELNFTIYKAISNTQRYYSPTEGAILRAFQGYGKFNFYEELVFKNGYKYNKSIDVDTSYNLSLAVQYSCSKNLTFSLKGENLLSDDMNVLYPDYSNISSIVYKAIPNSDRRAILSMKWVF